MLTDQRTDGPTDEQTKPLIELRVRNIEWQKNLKEGRFHIPYISRLYSWVRYNGEKLPVYFSRYNILFDLS